MSFLPFESFESLELNFGTTTHFQSDETDLFSLMLQNNHEVPLQQKEDMELDAENLFQNNGYRSLFNSQSAWNLTNSQQYYLPVLPSEEELNTPPVIVEVKKRIQKPKKQRSKNQFRLSLASIQKLEQCQRLKDIITQMEQMLNETKKQIVERLLIEQQSTAQ